MIPAEEITQHVGFSALASIPGITHDLRYASTNNFSGRVLYAGIDCAYLRSEAAQGLQRAAEWLTLHRPGYQLLVLDALRPQRVQDAIWQQVKGTPMEMYFANPEQGSIHSFGMAVDVTLLDPQRLECDMGSAFDEMTLASHPALHAEHLASGVLTPAQVSERGWLLRAMQHGGFHGISTEWWHFDFGDRDAVRRNLPRVV